MAAKLFDIHHALHLNVGRDIAIHDVRGHEAWLDIFDTSLLQDRRLAKQLDHRPGGVLHDDFANLFGRLVSAVVADFVNNFIHPRFQNIHEPGGTHLGRHVPVQFVLRLGSRVDKQLAGLDGHFRLAKQRDDRRCRVRDVHGACRLRDVPGVVTHAVMHAVHPDGIRDHRAGDRQLLRQQTVQAVRRSRTVILIRHLCLVSDDRLAKRRDDRRRPVHHPHGSSDLIRRVPGGIRHVKLHRVTALGIDVHIILNLQGCSQVPINAIAGLRTGVVVLKRGLHQLFRLTKQGDLWLGRVHNMNHTLHRDCLIVQTVNR